MENHASCKYECIEGRWTVANLIFETDRLLQNAITQLKHSFIILSKNHRNLYAFFTALVMNTFLYNKN